MKSKLLISNKTTPLKGMYIQSLSFERISNCCRTFSRYSLPAWIFGNHCPPTPTLIFGRYPTILDFNIWYLTIESWVYFIADMQWYAVNWLWYSCVYVVAVSQISTYSKHFQHCQLHKEFCASAKEILNIAEDSGACSAMHMAFPNKLLGLTIAHCEPKVAHFRHHAKPLSENAAIDNIKHNPNHV